MSFKNRPASKTVPNRHEQCCFRSYVSINSEHVDDHVQNILRKPKFSSEKVNLTWKPPSPICNAVISSPTCSSDIILTCDSIVGGGVGVSSRYFHFFPISHNFCT